MRKMITMGIIATLAFGLTGCDLFEPAEPIEPIVVVEDPIVIEDPVVETKIVDTEDYLYNKETGELTTAEDETVLYVNEDNPNTYLHVLGLDGDKLIIFKTGSDNSPGPGFEYEVWVADYVAQDIYFLDVTDPEEGLNSYTIPQYKIDEERVLLANYRAGGVLLYSTAGSSANVSTSSSTFDLTAETLESMADECGTEYEEGYFDDLVEAYADTPKYTYDFTYNGDSQDPDTYTVTVLVDAMEYGTNFAAVKADFDQCFAGGDMYPINIAYNHIIFVSSCGTGFNDGSDDPIGCDDIRKVIEPTLEINPEMALI